MILNLVCENGIFGKDCVYKCEGYCLNDEFCNNIDGMCLKCLLGWVGEFCNISKMSVFFFWNESIFWKFEN